MNMPSLFFTAHRVDTVCKQPTEVSGVCEGHSSKSVPTLNSPCLNQTQRTALYAAATLCVLERRGCVLEVCVGGRGGGRISDIAYVIVSFRISIEILFLKILIFFTWSVTNTSALSEATSLMGLVF